MMYCDDCFQIEACIVVVFSVLLVRSGGAEHTPSYPKAFLPTSAPFGQIAHSLVFGILVFCGFEGAAALGEETQNPKQNIGRAVVGSVCITGRTLFQPTCSLWHL
jgi:amino acid transporter